MNWCCRGTQTDPSLGSQRRTRLSMKRLSIKIAHKRRSGIIDMMRTAPVGTYSVISSLTRWTKCWPLEPEDKS